MPKKGTRLKYGKKDYVFNSDLYDKIVAKTGLKLSYKEAQAVIAAHLKNIGQVLETELDGFKLPWGLGYICAIKYVSKTPSINWKLTRQYKKTVYHTNADTLGFATTIKLFKVGRRYNNSFYDAFMFKPDRKLFRGIVHKFRAGQPYLELTHADFIEKSRLENMYSKKHRKDLKD